LFADSGCVVAFVLVLVLAAAVVVVGGYLQGFGSTMGGGGDTVRPHTSAGLTFSGVARSVMKAKKWATAMSPAASPVGTGGAGGAASGGSSSPVLSGDSEAFGRRMPYASDYTLSSTTTSIAGASGGVGRPLPSGAGGGTGVGYGGSRPVSRAAARDHFTTTHKKSFTGPKPGAKPEFGTGHGMATLRPTTSGGRSTGSGAGSGRFSEALRPSDGRIHSKASVCVCSLTHPFLVSPNAPMYPSVCLPRSLSIFASLTQSLPLATPVDKYRALLQGCLSRPRCGGAGVVVQWTPPVIPIGLPLHPVQVNHFEAGADDFTYGGFEPTGKAPFGTSGARFVESTVVHAGLIDGYTAAEVARGIKPGRLVSSNATSASNPLATSAYQVCLVCCVVVGCALARGRPVILKKCPVACCCGSGDGARRLSGGA
jgi:hypothetical protein